MNKIFLSLMIMVVGLVSAQTHRFFYEVDFRRDIRSQERTKELMVLDIGEEEIKFYAHKMLKADSLYNLPNYGDLISSGQLNPTPNFEEKLKRKKGTNENISYYAPALFAYYSVKTKDSQDWKLQPEKKQIGDLKVQRATADFGGRSWEAWFCADIPFPEGPHKFRGLPGLILELKDTQGDYHFTFAGNKIIKEKVDTTFFLETDSKNRNPIEIDEKKLRKIQKDYYENPYKDLGNSKAYRVVNGERQPVDAREEIARMREFILKYKSNPIEIDKAVKYTK
ncbi:MAG: GLPGLI family protein [Bergeyella zoohelcum]|nr:GLPGLI family protein [Bergeyella zoohelcum]